MEKARLEQKQRVRRANERGVTRLDWLTSYHTFSFGDYFDPRFAQFSALRVLNEDRISPSSGFSTHAHRDMEIVTYVLSGAIEHEDNLGNRIVVRAGDFQYMSAGKGILHSEWNPFSTPVHLLQMWVTPAAKALTPHYGSFSTPGRVLPSSWIGVLSPKGGEGAIAWRQEAELFLGRGGEGAFLPLSLPADRHVWIQVAAGSVDLGGVTLQVGDGMGITPASGSLPWPLEMRGLESQTDVLVFVLP